MAPVGRALIMTKNRGLIRVYGDKKSGKLLGASLFCIKGEHLAHLDGMVHTAGSDSI